MHTTDGGADWTAQVATTGYQLNRIVFGDALNGWAAGQANTIFHTTDGGDTWQPESGGVPAQNLTWSGLAAVGTAGAVLGGTDGAVSYSTGDGTWWPAFQTVGALAPPLLDSNADELSQVATADANDAWATITTWSGGMGLAHTSDGGATWSVSGVTLPNPPADLQFVDALHGWAASSHGAILRTTDGGQSWQETDVPPGEWPACLSFIDDQQGFCQTNKLYKTTDGGQSWQEISDESGGDVDLQFVDAQHGWFTWSAFVARTTDGGATWARPSVSSLGQITAIRMADTLHGWIVGPNGAVHHSTDGGVTWSAQASGLSGDLDSIDCVNAQTAWVAGKGSYAWTTNGGATWNPERVDVSSDDPLSLSFCDARHGFMVGGDNEIFGTTTGGVSTVVAPRSTASPGSCWRDKSTVVTITAVDQPGGKGVREICAQGGNGQPVAGATAKVTFGADTKSHSNDGLHTLVYWAVGMNSGVEVRHTETIGIDTRAPLVTRLSHAMVYRGKNATVRYTIEDPPPCQGTASVTILVKTRTGKVVKTVKAGVRRALFMDGSTPNGLRYATSFKCSLPKGAYRYQVKVTDAAGNSKTSAANWLQVV